MKPPWEREPDKWTCPECGSHNLSAPEAVVWTCVDCGCRKSFEAFARSAPVPNLACTATTEGEES